MRVAVTLFAESRLPGPGFAALTLTQAGIRSRRWRCKESAPNESAKVFGIRSSLIQSAGSVMKPLSSELMEGNSRAVDLGRRSLRSL